MARVLAHLRSHGAGTGKRIPSPVQRDSLRPSAKGGGEEKVMSGKPSWMSAPIKPGQFAGKEQMHAVMLCFMPRCTSHVPRVILAAGYCANGA